MRYGRGIGPAVNQSPARSSQVGLRLSIKSFFFALRQFFIVPHSPILLGLPDAAILSFDDGPLHPISYEDTDSYQITSLFLSDRRRILHDLLEE